MAKPLFSQNAVTTVENQVQRPFVNSLAGKPNSNF
jgi:hypothetical protein